MKQLFDIETEEALLGALIVEPDAYLKVSEIVGTTDFYKRQHSYTFEAVETLFKENVKIDLLTVVNQLKRQKSDVSAYDVTAMTSRVASAGHIEHHARIVKELSVRRSMIVELEKLKQIGQDTSNDLDSFIDRASLFADRVIGDIEHRSKIVEFKVNVEEAVKSIQERQNRDGNITHGVIPSLIDVRKHIPIWENGNLIIVAARPGMGKTAFVVHESVHIAATTGPVLFFSLEMKARELTSRILQRESGLSRYDFDRMTAKNWEVLDDAIPRVSDLGIFIDDTPGVAIGHIKAKTKIFKKQHNIRAIVVDYLQLMAADKRQPREQQVAEISKSMKMIAKEFEIPVFLVAQLNRQTENRRDDGYKPKLSDLRESGAIEQDADIVIFPYRPAYYQPNDESLKGIANIFVAKNRHGMTGVATLRVNETITKFFDADPGYIDREPPF